MELGSTDAPRAGGEEALGREILAREEPRRARAAAAQASRSVRSFTAYWQLRTKRCPDETEKKVGEQAVVEVPAQRDSIRYRPGVTT